MKSLLLLALLIHSTAAYATDPVAGLGGALAGVVNGYTAMVWGAIGNPARFLTALQTGTTRDIAAAVS